MPWPREAGSELAGLLRQVQGPSPSVRRRRIRSIPRAVTDAGERRNRAAAISVGRAWRTSPASTGMTDERPREPTKQRVRLSGEGLEPAARARRAAARETRLALHRSSELADTSVPAAIALSSVPRRQHTRPAAELRSGQVARWSALKRSELRLPRRLSSDHCHESSMARAAFGSGVEVRRPPCQSHNRAWVWRGGETRPGGRASARPPGRDDPSGEGSFSERCRERRVRCSGGSTAARSTGRRNSESTRRAGSSRR